MDFWLPLIAPPLVMMILASWVTAALLIDGMADDMFWGEGFWLKRWILLARKHPMLKWLNLIGFTGLAGVGLGYAWLAIS
ncbi:MAG: hypothetical protein GXP01_01700 [Alphaproteobacteria bacterium]|nr:hypothetical protein [Alphaproteobacteria bacterium]